MSPADGAAVTAGSTSSAHETASAAQTTARPTARAKPPQARSPKARKPVAVAFALDPEQPPLIQAASLTLSVLSWTKAGTVSNLDRLLEAGDPGATRLVAAIRLTPEQAALLDAPEHSGVLAALQCPPGFTGTPVTVQMCQECGRWSLTYSSAIRSCRMTAGCPGTVIRAGRAKRIKPGAEQATTTDSPASALTT